MFVDTFMGGILKKPSRSSAGATSTRQVTSVTTTDQSIARTALPRDHFGNISNAVSLVQKHSTSTTSSIAAEEKRGHGVVESNHAIGTAGTYNTNYHCSLIRMLSIARNTHSIDKCVSLCYVFKMEHVYTFLF